MIQEILEDIRNYYLKTHSIGTKVESDGVTVNNIDEFVINQYVWINNSILNDGVYKIAGISSNKLLIDGLQAEEKDDFDVHGLAIPKIVLDLVSDIEAYNTENPNGIASETLGDYSVNYAGDQNGNASWKNVFAKRLSALRKVYLHKGIRYDSRC